MGSLFNLIALLFMTGEGIRDDQRNGRWMWAKFLFALAFGAIECVLVILPVAHSSHYPDRYFPGVYLAAMVLALANFAWFIPVMRRWKQPNAEKQG